MRAAAERGWVASTTSRAADLRCASSRTSSLKTCFVLSELLLLTHTSHHLILTDREIYTPRLDATRASSFVSEGRREEREREREREPSPATMEATRIGGGMRKTSCFGLRRVPACLASTRRDRDGAATTSAHGARRNGGSPRSHRARIANPRASSSPAMAESVDAASGEEERAPASAFVAGATGRTGLRVVKELVESGISVKAGVRSSAKYEETFKSILSDAEKAEKLSFEQIDLDDGRTLANGVSGCDVVVCCLGAPENEFNPENPKRIDGDGVIALIDEAKRSGTCSHFVLVTSLGTGRFGWPASILNLFFGVLFHKKRAEDHLVKSGLAFTIVRPGGMERPTDDYYVQNEAVLRPQDTQFGGQVSRTQVSWLVRDCVNNPSKAQNKVIEVVTKKAKVVGAEDGAKKKKDKDEEEEYETYDLSLVDQLEKIPSAGNAAAEGTPAWFTSR